MCYLFWHEQPRWPPLMCDTFSGTDLLKVHPVVSRGILVGASDQRFPTNTWFVNGSGDVRQPQPWKHKKYTVWFEPDICADDTRW